MRDSLYHKILRVSAAVATLVLVFVSGLVSERTANLASQTQSHLANAVGVSVGVEETELNRITAALTERERTLAERELALEQREIDVGIRTDAGEPVRSVNTTLILVILLSIIIVLLLLNYILDYLRYRQFSVSLEQQSEG